MSGSPVRLLAFYLPQYHPIPENDAWWGAGFTEWTNVAKARPLFPGHYQPHLPADLGFYDLRLPAARQAQAELARAYGIDGFVYYHYWFNGKRLLERPFDQVLASGQPDLPFCLCWANENWTRAWDGNNSQILMSQQYSKEDDRNHIRWLLSAFQDNRYIRVDGRPLMLVYRASLLPDPGRTTTLWREEARRCGIGDLYLCQVENFGSDRTDPQPLGFDASVEFQPDSQDFGIRLHNPIYGDHFVYDYASLVHRQLRKPVPPYKRFPCVTPGWDNSARRQSKAMILIGSTPELYERWLRTAIRTASRQPEGERLVFINAWNEWGEGNHLEPDLVFGRKYLEATLRARQESAGEPEDDPSAVTLESQAADAAYLAALEQEVRRLQNAYIELEHWARDLEATVKRQQADLEAYDKLLKPLNLLRSVWNRVKGTRPNARP